MKEIGSRIARAREESGYTQGQLAERIPCNPQTVSNWETGRRLPRYADLKRLGEVLHHPVSWFLGEEESASPARQAVEELRHLTEGLERVKELLARPPEPVRAAPPELETFVPVSGHVAPGPLSEVVAEAAGWRLLNREQAHAVDYLLRVDGDALHPFIMEGDHVGVQRRPAEEEVAEGAFVVARIDEGRTVLKKYSRVGNQPQLVSVNPFYAPLKPAQLEVTGMVRWVWRDLGPGEAGTAEHAARTLFEWLQEVDGEISRLERRLERGQGRWTELMELCREVQEAAEKLRSVYGASVIEPAAKGLTRLARALYEQGHLRESVEKHEQAAAYFDQIEQAQQRSSASLLNAHNLAESYLLLGDVEKALKCAEKVSHADDWRVRWLGLKTMAEIRYNFQASPPDTNLVLCDELLELARQHEAEDPEEVALLRSGVHEIRVNFFLTHHQPDRALQEARQEIAESERSGRLDRFLTAQLDQALCATAVGDVEQAEAALETFDRWLQEHDLVEAAKELRAVAEAIRADAATLRGNPEEAQEHAHRGLKGALETGSLRGVMLNELSYARACRAAGKEEVARFHADEAAQSAADFHLEPYREMIAAWRSERNGG